ncbi:MAG: hypothetical protein M1825_003816 [Sarcosagium campestre]|nr:MAG: hypothetical protein M1825_003816 [Sarcosagium campestre]
MLPWAAQDLPPVRFPDLIFPPSVILFMASSEVDQKYLGQFAKSVMNDNPYLSSMLFKVLGLSVLLSKKLVRARKLRKLDTTRDTKSLQLYHHIIWLSREGLVIIEQYIIPMVDNNFRDLKVLAYKLRASFYHIFVLFHNDPPATQVNISTLSSAPPALSFSQGTTNGNGIASIQESLTTKDASGKQAMNGGPVGGHPPGLSRREPKKPATSFLLPTMDFIPIASSCFADAAYYADSLLAGSHPVRLSVKLEFAAFRYDCLKDAERSRKLAKAAIADVYSAQEGMDDDMFEDAAELVSILSKMARRGLNGTPGSTPGAASTSTPDSRATTLKASAAPLPSAPSPGMSNPI